jgi:hypothetical protein
MPWAEYYERWHEFYLMAGTASVTLAGLLFVALSLHIDALIHETREHLLQLARIILFSFLLVLLLSLLMLVPAMSERLIAIDLMLLGGIFLGLTRAQMRWRPKVDQSGFSTATVRRRAILPMIGYGIVLLTGALLFFSQQAQVLNFATGGVCMLLGNAIGGSWDLLVRVARIKREDVGTAPR